MESTCAMDHGPRLVEVSKLAIDIYPVTNREYAAFLKETEYQPEQSESFLRHWNSDPNNRRVPNGIEERPVVWVSTSDAQAFASWAGRRLPTDEEWQYIAAGPDLLPWPWGREFDSGRCNHDGQELCDVTSHSSGVSWCGAHDLSGNAWEWTSSTIDDGMHQFALIRGGSFYHGPERWHIGGGARRCDYHWKIQLMNPGINRAATVGFRCVSEVAS